MKKIVIKRALVIRFRRVGDAVLAVCICRSLKDSFPNIQVDFVLNENIAPLFTRQPVIDRLITFSEDEKHNIGKYISRIRKITREGKYDLIIDMRSTINTLPFCMFSPQTPFRIGTKKTYSLFVHNYRVENLKDKTKDMVQCDLMLLKPLEKIDKVQYNTSFALYVPEDEKTSYRNYMQRQGIDFAHPIILVAAATRIEGKGWDLEKMKNIIGRMIDKYNPQIIFNYAGEREKNISAELHEKLDNDTHAFMNIEAKSLVELRALTSLSTFFFGNEGGPRHISQAVGIPSFAIYPPGISKTIWLPSKDKRFQGISPDDLATAHELSQMNHIQRFGLITPENVWARLEPMLDGYLNQSPSI